MLTLQGAVGLAIWVAAVGNQKKPSPRESASQLDLDGGQSSMLRLGRVWRRTEGSGNEIELCIMDSDDDPNSIFVSEETLMEECVVCILSVILFSASLFSFGVLFLGVAVRN